jgi:putative peptidoglycan lipid II flippase
MTALSFSTSIAVLAEAAILLWLLHQQVGSLRLRSLLSFVIRLCIATMALALTLLITLWLANSFLVTTSSDPTQSPGLTGIMLVSLKVLICCAAGAFVYLRAARFLHILEVEQLGPVHRLLVRLHLSWI